MQFRVRIFRNDVLQAAHKWSENMKLESKEIALSLGDTRVPIKSIEVGGQYLIRSAHLEAVLPRISVLSGWSLLLISRHPVLNGGVYKLVAALSRVLSVWNCVIQMMICYVLEGLN